MLAMRAISIDIFPLMDHYPLYTTTLPVSSPVQTPLSTNHSSHLSTQYVWLSTHP